MCAPLGSGLRGGHLARVRARHGRLLVCIQSNQHDLVVRDGYFHLCLGIRVDPLEAVDALAAVLRIGTLSFTKTVPWSIVFQAISCSTGSETGVTGARFVELVDCCRCRRGS